MSSISEGRDYGTGSPGVPVIYYSSRTDGDRYLATSGWVAPDGEPDRTGHSLALYALHEISYVRQAAIDQATDCNLPSWLSVKQVNRVINVYDVLFDW